MARLLYPSHNSRKFTEGLQRLAWDSPPYSVTPVAATVIVPPVAYTRNSISAHRRQDELLVSTTTEEEKEEFSKEDIGGVVEVTVPVERRVGDQEEADSSVDHGGKA